MPCASSIVRTKPAASAVLCNQKRPGAAVLLSLAPSGQELAERYQPQLPPTRLCERVGGVAAFVYLWLGVAQSRHGSLRGRAILSSRSPCGVGGSGGFLWLKEDVAIEASEILTRVVLNPGLVLVSPCLGGNGGFAAGCFCVTACILQRAVPHILPQTQPDC